MITDIISKAAVEAIKELYQCDFPIEQLVVQPTREDIDGDYTLVVFPVTKVSKKKPIDTAQEIGEFISAHVEQVEKFSVINGFLNFTVKADYWNTFLNQNFKDEKFGYSKEKSDKTYVLEFSSPNTNKPLHLGHIRNNLLGVAVSNLYKAAGHNVIKVNLVNDRGVHICKSMYAWQQWGNNATPETSDIKGDHLVGDYYVEFDKHYKTEINELMSAGMTEDEAKRKAPSMVAVREMLSKWENDDPEVLDLWTRMNSWVYDGFDITYQRLGVTFDKVYHESETYLLGKEIVKKAQDKGLLQTDPDNSVWIDLTDEGLDRKILLRSDGTSVYITQDIGTAVLRHDEFKPDKLIYVVGNEQIYHFDVLKKTLKRLGYDWADSIYHLSYGMVELTTGKMKSREGTVVDADDLMDEMEMIAKGIIEEQGKVEPGTPEAQVLSELVGAAALKYFILKVDPKKNMLFDPNESIDFNGNTGPFIQYTYARIYSLLQKANFNASIFNFQISSDFIDYKDEELTLIKMIHEYPLTIAKAANDDSPAQIANFIYELAKAYNRFYQNVNVLKEENIYLRNIRLMISYFTSNIIKSGVLILGINVPKKM